MSCSEHDYKTQAENRRSEECPYCAETCWQILLCSKMLVNTEHLYTETVQMGERSWRIRQGWRGHFNKFMNWMSAEEILIVSDSLIEIRRMAKKLWLIEKSFSSFSILGGYITRFCQKVLTNAHLRSFSAGFRAASYSFCSKCVKCVTRFWQLRLPMQSNKTQSKHTCPRKSKPSAEGGIYFSAGPVWRITSWRIQLTNGCWRCGSECN